MRNPLRVPSFAATRIPSRSPSPYSDNPEHGLGRRNYSDVSDTASDFAKERYRDRSVSTGRYVPRWQVPQPETKSPSNLLSRWPRLTYAMMIIAVLIISTLVALLIYFNIHLRRQLAYKELQRAIDMRDLVASWAKPGAQTQDSSHYPTDFSRGITPIPCHSHNDYWRTIPLYEALAAGCTGVEADVWHTDNDLRVGHSRKSLTSARTLTAMYIDPLVSILTHQNPASTPSNSTNGTATQWSGIFETNTSASLTLLIDMKTDGADTLPVVLQQLEPLRSKGWLTHFDGTNVVRGPITVVGTGNTPFDLLTANSTYRDMFFDAPLDHLSDTNGTVYTTQNSYYASVSFAKTIGKLKNGLFSSQQMSMVKEQVSAANARGLKARYWDAPGWPIGQRDEVWDFLEKEGVGMLNADDVNAVSKRKW